MREVTCPPSNGAWPGPDGPGPGFEISYPAMMVTGTNEAEMQAAVQAVKAQLAFYARRPPTGPCSTSTAGGTSAAELNTLSKRGEWVQMADLIPDDMLDTFAVVGRDRGDPGQGPRALRGHGHPGQLLRPLSHGPRALIQELLAGFRAS